jgi:chemosensory pili system protein ChpA (sensor histidine kinase/response regulator)
MTEETASNQMQVLVADDDLAILRLVKAIAEKEGYSVVTARDGREAYKILQDQDNFAVAVLDVVMPYIQGTELARYMQTENRLKRIPIIMMTAEQNPRLSAESFSAGAVVFLPKPFTTSQLQVMMRMLSSSAAAEE